MCTKWIYQSSIFVPRTFTGTYPSPSSRRLVSCNFCVQVVSFEMDLKAKAKDPWNGACSCVTDTCQACAWRSSTSRKSKDPFQSCAFQSCAVCHAFVVKNKNKILIYHSTTHLYSKICRSRGSKVEHLSSEQKVAGSIPVSMRRWHLNHKMQRKYHRSSNKQFLTDSRQHRPRLLTNTSAQKQKILFWWLEFKTASSLSGAQQEQSSQAWSASSCCFRCHFRKPANPSKALSANTWVITRPLLQHCWEHKVITSHMSHTHVEACPADWSRSCRKANSFQWNLFETKRLI